LILLVIDSTDVFHFFMARHRSSSPLDDLFDLLAMIFRFVPPWVSIPVAIVGFLVIVSLSPSFTGPLASLNGVVALFAVLFGGIFALVCLAAGFKGWQMRQRQQAFLTEHVDIGWLNNPNPEPHVYFVRHNFKDQSQAIKMLKRRKRIAIRFTNATFHRWEIGFSSRRVVPDWL
jgi:hypothetical protein